MRRLVLLLAATFAVGCAPARTPSPARRAFYSWKTTLDLSPTEVSALDGLHVERLYLHYLDVDTATPMTRLVARAPAVGRAEIVPVVFIRERALRHIEVADIATLAHRIWEQVTAISADLHVTPREVQLDCDWTEGSRASYFELLRVIRELAAHDGATLSATIRLHQVKFRERTGVPPVDRGMLMFYNMGQIGADASDHAIFDASVASKYLARLADYPLPLDVALPIWAWTVHVRDGRVEGLLQSTDPATLSSLDFLQPAGPLRWTVTRPTFVDGTFVRAGDVLQGESVDPATALAAANQIAAVLPARADRTVSLFELSERNLARHDRPSLEILFNAVH